MTLGQLSILLYGLQGRTLTIQEQAKIVGLLMRWAENDFKRQAQAENVAESQLY